METSQTVAEHSIRKAIIDACCWMNATGLNQGTAGNISVRHGEGFLVSPSATPYEQMTPDMVAYVRLDTEDGAFEGPLAPSTEWRFHRDILRARPELNAVLHAHPTYATALAMARKSIPPCHYMIAAFGGPDIRCAPYARYGTAELSVHAVAALEGRMGCLLANHGMITAGPTLESAKWFATELETLSRQYHLSLLIGGPVLLDHDQIDEAAAAMSDYGLKER